MLKAVSTSLPADALRPPAARWYALTILMLIFALHYVDRAVLAVLIEPIKTEFRLSDSAMGFLSTTIHSTAQAVFLLPLGWLVDRSNRVRLLTLFVILWSSLTALCALAGSYALLLVIRFTVGAAESGAPLASVSLIADLFKPKERPTAMGIYYCGLGLGTGLTFLIGGYLAHLYGWRTVFLIAGVPGILLALLFLATVREPARLSEDGGAPDQRESSGMSLIQIALHPPILLITCAGCLAAIAMNTVWIWLASFLIRAHGFDLAQAGMVIAAAGVIGKGLGSLTSGPITRYLSNDRPEAFWRFPSAALTASAIVGWLMVTSSGSATVVMLAVLLGATLGSWPAQATNILVAAAPKGARATAFSFYQLATTLIGGVGPFLAGALSDGLGGGMHIGAAIASMLCLNIGAAILFLASCRTLGSSSAARTALS